MQLLNVHCIVETFNKCIESLSDKNDHYSPKEDSLLLTNCIEELYQASFSKEEGRQIQFRIFLGDASDIEPNTPHRNVGYSKEHFIQEYTKYDDSIELNSDNLRKIGLSCDPNRFIIIVNKEASKLYIKGIVYLSGLPLEDTVNKFTSNSWEKNDLKFSGFVFESRAIGSLIIRFNNYICNIQDGRVNWIDLSRKNLDKYIHKCPLNEEIQKIYKSGSFTDSYLYEPLIDAIGRVNNEKCGGTLICTTDDELERLVKSEDIDIKYKTNILLKDPDSDNLLKMNYWYNKISDLIYYFSRIDGAAVITNSSIKGYGAKISNVNKKSLPKELQNKGTRHQSAYSIVEKSEFNLFVFIVSADGGVTFIRKANGQPEIFYFNGVEFTHTAGKAFEYLPFSDGFG